MSGSELYGQTIANQQELSQVDESAKPEKGESINRIAFELQKKDQRPKNQEAHSDSSLSISGIPSDRTPVQPFGHHDFQQKLRFHQNIADFGFRSHQILNFGQRLTNRSQSEDEYPTDRPGSPSMLGRVSMQRQQLSQQFSTEHSDYEEGTKKRKLYDDEASELEDLDHFAQEFKRKRIKMGFTQGDVGVAMGKLYGNDFSQTTISRFEALNLSVKNMCKLKPLLERWLVDVNHALSRGNGSEGRAITFQPMVQTPQQSLKPRKKRTSIPTHGKAKLEDAFIKNPKPTSEEIYKYSEDLKMDREVVRVWFCNRRQKQKRITIQQQQYIGEDGSSSPSSPSRQFSCNGPNDGRRSSPSSDDESFHTSQQMPPIIQPHFGREARLNSSQLELTANEAVKASSVPKAVPAGETSALRLPSLAAAAHLSRPEVIMQTDAFSHPPPLRAAPQGFSPTSFFPMKSESTTS